MLKGLTTEIVGFLAFGSLGDPEGTGTSVKVACRTLAVEAIDTSASKEPSEVALAWASAAAWRVASSWDKVGKAAHRVHSQAGRAAQSFLGC